MDAKVDHADNVHRAVTAWELAGDGRRAEVAETGGVFVRTLIGHGEPMVGTSRIDEADASAQALSIANERAYREKYGTPQWLELARILNELREMAGK